MANPGDARVNYGLMSLDANSGKVVNNLSNKGGSVEDSAILMAEVLTIGTANQFTFKWLDEDITQVGHVVRNGLLSLGTTPLTSSVASLSTTFLKVGSKIPVIAAATTYTLDTVDDYGQSTYGDPLGAKTVSAVVNYAPIPTVLDGLLQQWPQYARVKYEGTALAPVIDNNYLTLGDIWGYTRLTYNVVDMPGYNQENILAANYARLQINDAQTTPISVDNTLAPLGFYTVRCGASNQAMDQYNGMFAQLPFGRFTIPDLALDRANYGPAVMGILGYSGYYWNGTSNTYVGTVSVTPVVEFTAPGLFKFNQIKAITFTDINDATDDELEAYDFPDHYAIAYEDIQVLGFIGRVHTIGVAGLQYPYKTSVDYLNIWPSEVFKLTPTAPTFVKSGNKYVVNVQGKAYSEFELIFSYTLTNKVRASMPIAPLGKSVFVAGDYYCPIYDFFCSSTVQGCTHPDSNTNYTYTKVGINIVVRVKLRPNGNKWEAAISYRGSYVNNNSLTNLVGLDYGCYSTGCTICGVSSPYFGNINGMSGNLTYMQRYEFHELGTLGSTGFDLTPIEDSAGVVDCAIRIDQNMDAHGNTTQFDVFMEHAYTLTPVDPTGFGPSFVFDIWQESTI